MANRSNGFRRCLTGMAAGTLLCVLTASVGYAQTPPTGEPNPASAPTPAPAPTPQSLSSFGGDVPFPPFGDVQAQYNSYELDMLGDDLVGDHTDGDTGSLSLTQTDVSIPGNSALPVSFGRQRSRSGVRGSWLADWTPTIPSISKHFLGGYGPNTNRCTNDLLPAPIQGTGGGQYTINALAYFTGYHLDIPGRNPGPLVGVPNGGPSPEFPSNARLVSKNNWVVSCTTNALSGGDGFLATAPNGDKYTFGFQKTYYERDISLPAYDGSLPPSQTNPNFDNTSADEQVYKEVLYVTKIEDVYGNYVNYEYTGGRPSKILADDGRQITFGYSGSLISSVTANGRTWNYQYTAGNLTGVTLPDGRAWSIDADSFALNPWVTSICAFSANNIDPVIITHPNGATVRFDFDLIKNGRTHMDDVQVDPGTSNPSIQDCFLGDINGPNGQKKIPSGFYSFAVTKKTLSMPNVSDYVWTREYEEDFTPADTFAGSYTDATSHPSDIKTRTITDPLGHKTVMHYNRRNGPLEGALTKVEIIPSGTTTPMKVTDYSYLGGHLIGIDLSAGGALTNGAKSRPIYQTKHVVSQDGDTYTTDMVYNQNQASAAYSYGKPVQTSAYANFQATPRVIDITYEHQKTPWILGLTKTVTQAGQTKTSYIYNNLGQKTSESRFGQTVATYGYHTTSPYAGQLYWMEDALGNRQEADNWKRGTPQLLRQWLDKSADNPNENRWLNQTRIVDNNGWVTSATDALSQTTSYGRDNMGRLTQINPPSGFFNSTNISYNFNAGGATPVVQTITKGSATTVVRHDAMLRPRLVEQTTTGWSSYSETQYDPLGRPTFQSRPGSSPHTLSGTSTTYDALGRPKRREDTADASIYADYYYFSGNRAHEARPNGRYTSIFRDGYAGPGQGSVLEIQEAGRRTYLYRNDFDNVWQIRQRDFLQSGGAQSVRQYFVYDAQQRPCMHYVPEHGETRYLYDAAGRVIHSAKGQSWTYSCSTSIGTLTDPGSAASVVNHIYDSLSRPIQTDFVDPATKDVENIYDDIGQLTQTRRSLIGFGPGNIVNELHRTYDVLGNVLTESQQIDGVPPMTFTFSYSYDPNGYMNGRNYPSNHKHIWTNDGFGHQRDLLPDNGGYSYASNIQYYPDGSLKRYTMGNGQTFKRFIDGLNRTQQLYSAPSTGLEALDIIYTYNANNQISSMWDTSTFGIGSNSKRHSLSNVQYDTLGQLTHADGWWGVGTFTYDGVGNMLTKSLGGRNVSLTYDAPTNRVTDSSESLGTNYGGTHHRAVGYDSRGNVTTLGPMNLVYDKTDQMVSSSGTAAGIGAAIGSYQYNGEGKRVRSEINGRVSYSVYDFAGRLMTTHKVADGEQVDRLYLQNGQTLAKWTGSTLTYLHTDHLGTPIRGTHGLGSGHTPGDEVFQDFFTPYGMRAMPGWNGSYHSGFEPMHGAGSNCGVTGFTTHANDCELGQTYMQARSYDPVMSRMLSVDPVTFLNTMEPGMVNRYAYTLNDPVNNVDPDGEQVVVLPREQGRTVIVYPQKTADHVDKRHSPTGTAQNKFTQTLGKNKGQVMAMRTIEKSVSHGSFVQEGNDTVYEGKLGGTFLDVGTQGENTNRVVTQDLATMRDPEMLSQVASELATPEAVGTLAALEAAAPANADPIKVEVVKTQHPVFEEDRKTGG